MFKTIHRSKFRKVQSDLAMSHSNGEIGSMFGKSTPTFSLTQVRVCRWDFWEQQLVTADIHSRHHSNWTWGQIPGSKSTHGCANSDVHLIATRQTNAKTTRWQVFNRKETETSIVSLLHFALRESSEWVQGRSGAATGQIRRSQLFIYFQTWTEGISRNSAPKSRERSTRRRGRNPSSPYSRWHIRILAVHE